MIILQINTTVNSGSTGRIAEEIGKEILSRGHKSFIAYGRGNQPSSSELISIGNNLDRRIHGIVTRLLDKHGFSSTLATKRLIQKIKLIQPDIIHLHNLHGYYINIEVLFKHLKSNKIPVVWTFHDCWPFTGHCCFFDYVNCFKWKEICLLCPNRKTYPSSWVIDNSKANFLRKKDLFCGLQNLTIVTPSIWLANHVRDSFLHKYKLQVIHNGVDLDVFKPIQTNKIRDKYHLENKRIILGVANVWSRRKGLDTFIKLSSLINHNTVIILVGLNKSQLKNLPGNIIGILQTENINELVSLYSSSDVFINPTLVDNFPNTNIEALGCGTPVITNETGGSPESIDEKTGIVVEKGDINGLYAAINEVFSNSRDSYTYHCRERALQLFDAKKRINEYLSLYEHIS